MKTIQDYIGQVFLHKKFHFICDCLIPLDVTGYVQDYEISHSEVILVVQVGQKLIKIGLNHPSLKIEEV